MCLSLSLYLSLSHSLTLSHTHSNKKEWLRPGSSLHKELLMKPSLLSTVQKHKKHLYNTGLDEERQLSENQKPRFTKQFNKNCFQKSRHLHPGTNKGNNNFYLFPVILFLSCPERNLNLGPSEQSYSNYDVRERKQHIDLTISCVLKANF